MFTLFPNSSFYRNTI